MEKPTASMADNNEEIRFSSDEEEEEEEEEELERALAEVPFDELQRARADGSNTVRPKPSASQQNLGRANKNRPMEISSKARVGRIREVVIQAPKKVVRDPRFESISGALDTDRFRKRYDFLFENELPAEKEKLQKLIKKSKDQKVIDELKNHISWMDKQLKSASQKKAGSEVLSKHIKNEREAAMQGKGLYYLKKSEIRRWELSKKFNELKAAGKLESFMEKRRKRTASKDHRYIPYRRSSENTQQ